ncbi:baseplate hub subunit and tail lysozyme [Vibrio phage D528]
MSVLKLTPRWFIGTIENVDDPTLSGLVQVRCLGVHLTDKKLLPTDFLPWAKVMMSPTSASNDGVGGSPTGLVVGAMCFGFSLDPGFTDLKITNTWHSTKDVNILARNNNEDELKISIVGKKKDSIQKGVPTAKSKWDEPVTPYAAKYPYNDVTVSRAGHVFEIDNTPESERLHWYHKSGTFQEVHPDGSKVTKIIGDGFDLYLKDRKLFVKGNCSVTVLGNAEVYVKGDKHEKIDGNLVQEVKGNVQQTVGGNLTETVTGNATTDAKGTVTQKSGGAMNHNAGGAVTVKGSTVSLN